MKTLGKIFSNFLTTSSLAVALLLVACNTAYETKPDRSATFIKFFGGFNSEKAYAAEQAADGGFICVGTTSSVGEGAADIYLLKTDAYGNKLWSRTFGGARNDEGRSVLEMADGGYVILGDYTNEQGFTDMILIKTDNAGNEEWRKTFGLPGGNEKAFALKVLAEGALLLIGNIVNANGSSDMYLVNTTLAGEMQWEKTYGLSGLKDDIGSVQETRQGNLVWCGAEYREKTGNIPGTSDMRVVLTRPEGSLLWDKNFGQDNSETGADIQLTGDGFVVVGTMYHTQSNDSDIFLVSLFDDGSLKWFKTYGGEENSYGQSVHLTLDGGYVIAGSTESTESGKDICLIKLNRVGEQEWKKTFGGKLDDTGNIVRPTADGGFILFGTVTFENNTMLCLIKTNAKGELVNK